MKKELQELKEKAQSLGATRLASNTFGDYLCRVNDIYNGPIEKVDYIASVDDRDNIIGAIDKVTYEDNSVDYYYWISSFAEKGLYMKENFILTLVFGGFILACTTWQWLGVVMIVIGLAIK